MGNEGFQFDLGGAAAPSPVPLAHSASFALGPLTAIPAQRRLDGPGGATTQLEPLVMQVLIALASVRGATLTRDDLIAACWDGRIVTDDAINRVISKLRRELAAVGGAAVRLETVPKVGYRLVAEDADEPAPPVAPVPALRARRVPRALAAAGMLGVAAAAAGGAWAYFGRPPAAADVTVAVEPVASTSTTREAQAFASALTGDLAQLAGAISRVSFVDDAGGGEESFIVRVAVDREADRLVARVRLVNGDDGAVMWSDRFDEAAGRPDRLRQQVAMATAGVMRCGLEPSAAVLGDAASVRLFFAACNAVIQDDPARAESLARQIVARRPDVGAGWACLAMTTLFTAWRGSPDEIAAARAKARGYARHALELDPHVGRAYQALALAAPQGSAEQLAILARGIAADPEQPALYQVQSYALFDSGYVKASVAPAQRALALDPTSVAQVMNVVRRLQAAGAVAEAMALQARAERQWPDEPAVLRERVSLLRFEPDAGKALARFDRIAAQMPGDMAMNPIVRAELAWRANPAVRDVAAIERLAEQAFAKDPIEAWRNATMLARLGQTERALAWVARAPGGDSGYQWSFLFWQDLAALRRDPRFFAAMGRLGLVKAWQARGEWPDFCAEPGLRYDCRAEAAKLGATRT